MTLKRIEKLKNKKIIYIYIFSRNLLLKINLKNLFYIRIFFKHK
jgi:hypothetical protein